MRSGTIFDRRTIKTHGSDWDMIMIYYVLLWFIMIYCDLLWFIVIYCDLLWFILYYWDCVVALWSSILIHLNPFNGSMMFNGIIRRRRRLPLSTKLNFMIKSRCDGLQMLPSGSGSWHWSSGWSQWIPEIHQELWKFSGRLVCSPFFMADSYRFFMAVMQLS